MNACRFSRSLHFSAAVFAVCLLAILVTTCTGCSVVNWRHMSMAEILYKAEIVVYGRETSRFQVPDTSIAEFTERTDSSFEVYCVFKLPSSVQSLSHNITIKGVAPRHGCSGTKYTLNEDIILALKTSETHEGYFEWDEVNVVPDGAAFPAPGEEQVNFTARVCGLQNPTLPDPGASDSDLPSCPARYGGACIKEGEPSINSGTYVGQNLAMFPLVLSLLCLILSDFFH